MSRNMKDSGISWIGQIPSDWDVKKLKYLSSMKSGDSITSDSIEETGDYPVFGGNGLRGYTNRYTHDGEFILIGRQGALCGNVRKVSGQFWPSEHAVVVYDGGKVNKGWYKYFLDNMNLNQYSTSAAQPGLSVDQIMNLFACVPPCDMQQAIANYLDSKTAAIDTLITDKQKLIGLLKDKRQAIINEAVTKGFNKSAKMKDSGVEWIGEMPEEWNVLTNRQLFVERNEKNSQEDVTLLSVTKYLGVILQSEAEDQNLATVAPSETLSGYKTVRKGDLVMNIMRAKDGSFGVSDYDGVISPAYCIYFARKKVNPEYLYYLFKTPMYIEIFKNYSTGIAEHRMRLYPDSFYKITAILPPITQQDAIVLYLNAETERINNVVLLLEKQIEKLKEYRQSIISEAVTGKVMIEDAQPNELPTSRRESVFRRLVLSAYILDNICDEPTAGRVKFEKLLYLSEHCAKLPLHSDFRRHAAGPYDPQALYSVDEQLKRNKWFIRNKDKKETRAYIRLEKSQGYRTYLDSNFTVEQKKHIDNLIEIFKGARTIQSEIVATLYGAWNDFLIEGTNPTDMQIVDEVLTNWHERKERIDRERWQAALNWMREKGIVPVGFGTSTKGGASSGD